MNRYPVFLARPAPAAARRRRAAILLLLAGCLLPIVASCGFHRHATPPQAQGVTSGRIAVLPFRDMARIYGVQRDVRSPLTGKVFTTGTTAPEVVAALDERVLAALGQRSATTVLGPETTAGAAADLMGGARPLDERRLVLETARRVNAEAVLLGYLYRFRGRTGGRFAVQEPASVALGVYLIAADSGRVLWQAEFDETQRSLSEDLLQIQRFFKRGGQWITAEKMALDALDQALERLPPLAGGPASD